MNNPFETIDARLSNIESLLLDLKHKPIIRTPDEEQDELLTIQQVAEILKLSVPSIYRLSSRKAIPFFKKSKRLNFSRQGIIEWVKSGRRKTFNEISAEADKYLNNQKKG